MNFEIVLATVMFLLAGSLFALAYRSNWSKAALVGIAALTAATLCQLLSRLSSAEGLQIGLQVLSRWLSRSSGPGERVSA